jgi:hypothetical protein
MYVKDTPLLLNTAANHNLTWLQAQIYNATDDIFNASNPRLQASISLDKEVYRPRDVVFVEVAVFNALTKVPVAFSAADRTN